MPLADNVEQDDLLINLLLLGFSKAGKTHWALEAAEAGYNVLFFDGDVGLQTVAKMPLAAKKRIYYFPFHDTMAVARMGILINKMVSEAKFMWNDTDARMLKPDADLSVTAVWALSLSKLTHRDVIVIDSLTALANSLMRQHLMKEGEDLNTFTELNSRQKQILYGGAGGILTFICLALKAAPCHVVVLGHPAEYEHKTKPDGVKAGELQEKDMKIAWTKQIPKSISNPHGATIAKHFSSVLWIEPTGFKNNRVVDGRPDPTKDIGGQFTDKKDSKEYSFVNLVKSIGGFIPDPSEYLGTPGLVTHAIGEFQPPSKSKLDARHTGDVVSSGLTGGLKTTAKLQFGKIN